MNAVRRTVARIDEAAVANGEVRRTLHPSQLTAANSRVLRTDVFATKLLDEQPVAHEAARSEIPLVVPCVAPFVPRRPDNALPALPAEEKLLAVLEFELGLANKAIFPQHGEGE